MAAHPGPSAAKTGRPRFFYGWVIAGVVAICQFSQSAEIFPVLGVLIKPMTEEFGWSRTTFTAATSIGTLAGGFAGPLVGPYVDRFGARNILLVAFTLLGGTMVGMAFITELWQFYLIQIAGRFLALGVISLSLQIIIPKWFVAKRARAIALSGLGGRLGNSITPIYVAFLVSVYDWRVATVTTGVVMLAMTLLPIALFMKRQPEDIGLLPDGITPEEKEQAEAAARAAGRPLVDEISLSLKQVSRMPAFHLLLGAQLVGNFVNPALNLHMIPYFTDQGLSSAVAVTATTTLFLAGALGALLFGLLSERFGIKAVLTLNYVLTGAGVGLLLLVSTPLAAVLWGAFMGTVQGGGQTLNQVMFPDYFGRGSLGAIRGAITPLTLGANAAGPLAAAIAFDLTGSYFAIFAAFGVFRVASAFLVVIARAPAGSAADQAQRRRAQARA